MFPGRDGFPTRARKLLSSGLFLLVFGSCFSIMLTLAYASLGEPLHEQYVTLSTSGSDMTTKGIYPSSSAVIARNDSLDWNVRLYNHMGDTEYLAVRIKLLNSTEFGPDEVLKVPSPASQIYEQRVVVASNETAVIPLSIRLNDMTVSGADSEIHSLTINGKDISGLEVANVNSKDFRFVIELWRYDTKFENFVFTWPSGTESESAWNQIRIQVK